MSGCSETEFSGKRALVTGGNEKGWAKPSSNASEALEPNGHTASRGARGTRRNARLSAGFRRLAGERNGGQGEN
jgi:hypothetical protein